MTYYLKYRPQTVAELDLAVIRGQLAAVLASGRMPHAFLFSGPKGLGKTSAARILAKAINCELRIKNKELGKNQIIEPCNQCVVCKSITNGMALDLIEIDAASNRGIDDIRALRETIKLSPSQLKYKVYIIDEVHMLTAEAFNALLKTLEEPPAHAVFVLATTEPQKLPETIISRCQRFYFKKPTTEEILRSLERIVKAEKLKIEVEVMNLIAVHSGGSFRDAAKILEQVSFTGPQITLEKVDQFLKAGSEFDVTSWLTFVLNKESKPALELLAKAVDEGVDLRWLVSQSLEKLRWLLLVEHQLIIPETEAEADFLKKSQVSVKEIIELAGKLDEAGRQLRDAVIPQLPIELAVMEWSEWSSASALETSQLLIQPCSPRDASADKKNQVGSSKGVIPSECEVRSTISQIRPINPISPIAPTNRKPLKTKLEDVQKNWEKILRALRPHNSSIEALLRSARPLKLEGNLLTIEAFYPFHKERLEGGKCPACIEKVLGEIFKEDIKIKCVLGKNQKAKKTEAAGGDDKNLKDVEEIFK